MRYQENRDSGKYVFVLMFVFIALVVLLNKKHTVELKNNKHVNLIQTVSAEAKEKLKQKNN